MLVQDYLKTHTYKDLEEEFGIIVGEYDDRIVLNYHQIDSYKHRFNPMVMECRALILRRDDHEVLCRSFDRFWNYGEDPNSDDFNVLRSIAYDKIDGSIMNVYHDGIHWCVSSRKMAFAEGLVPNKKRSYSDLFIEALGGQLDDVFSNINRNLTIIFEMVSPETRIVTPYKEPQLYLLNVRERLTGEFLGHELAYNWSTTGRWRYPYDHKFESFDDIVLASKKLPAMEEGYVVKDGSWMIKVKNPAYLAIAHLRDNGAITEKRVVKLVFMQDHTEYLIHFPEDQPEFDPYIKAYDKMIENIKVTDEYTHAIEDQKEYAMSIKDCHAKSILFAMRKDWNKSVYDILEGLTDNYKVRLIKGYMK